MQIAISQESFKSIASGLRREFKQLGVEAPSHNQMLEALAKSLGFTSYAQALAKAGDASAPVAAAPAEVPTEPLTPQAAAAKDLFVLRNEGQLDLGRADNTSCDDEDHGQLYHGMTWLQLEGTQDRVPCAANVMHVRRMGTDVDIDYIGESEVFWDDQKTDTDSRGVNLWTSGGVTDVAEDMAFIAPAWLNNFEGPLDPEIEENEDVQVRQALVDGMAKFLLEMGLREQALQELGLESPDGEFGPEFEKAAAYKASQKGSKRALGLAQYACGFAMHRKEFRALAAKLLG